MKFLTFRCHLKFFKFNLDKILYKFPSFWKFFKLLSKQWNSHQSIWIFLEHSLIQIHSKHSRWSSWRKHYNVSNFWGGMQCFILGKLQWNIKQSKIIQKARRSLVVIGLFEDTRPTNLSRESHSTAKQTLTKTWNQLIVKK